MKKLIIIISCLFFITGCYNYHELDELAIASSLLIDYKDNKYYIKVEVIEGEEAAIYDSEGLTLSDALEKAVLGTEKQLYYTHLNAVLLTENVDIKDTFLFLLRNPDINNTFYVVITESDNIYQDVEDEDMGEKISNILKRHQSDNFFDMSKIIFEDNQDLTIAYYTKEGKIDNFVIYKDLEIKEKLSLDNMEIYKILNSRSGSYITADCKEKNFSININKIKTSFKIGKKIKIIVDNEASLYEYNCNDDSSKPKVIYDIETKMNKEIKKNIEKLLNIIKDKETDIFGINRMIYSHYHKIDKQWYDYEYEVEVTTHINKKGLLLK